MSDNETPTPDAKESSPDGQELTQAEVDKIVAKVRAEERRKASEKFKDYDDLKAKAGEKQTLEERIAEMEQQAMQAAAATLRSDIAVEFGMPKGDRDLFLTATDEDTLRAQASRWQELSGDRKKNPPPVSKEGTVTDPTDNQDREFARQLFGRG